MHHPHPKDDNRVETDWDTDDNDTLEPKSINRFGPGILDTMAEIDFLGGDKNLPRINQIGFDANFSVLERDSGSMPESS